MRKPIHLSMAGDYAGEDTAIYGYRHDASRPAWHRTDMVLFESLTEAETFARRLLDEVERIRVKGPALSRNHPPHTVGWLLTLDRTQPLALEAA